MAAMGRRSGAILCGCLVGLALGQLPTVELFPDGHLQLPARKGQQEPLVVGRHRHRRARQLAFESVVDSAWAQLSASEQREEHSQDAKPSEPSACAFRQEAVENVATCSSMAEVVRDTNDGRPQVRLKREDSVGITTLDMFELRAGSSCLGRLLDGELPFSFVLNRTNPVNDSWISVNIQRLTLAALMDGEGAVICLANRQDTCQPRLCIANVKIQSAGWWDRLDSWLLLHFDGKETAFNILIRLSSISAVDIIAKLFQVMAVIGTAIFVVVVTWTVYMFMGITPGENFKPNGLVERDPAGLLFTSLVNLFSFTFGIANGVGLIITEIYFFVPAVLVYSILLFASFVGSFGVYRWWAHLCISQLFDVGLKHGKWVQPDKGQFLQDVVLIVSLVALMILLAVGAVLGNHPTQVDFVTPLASPFIGLVTALTAMWSRQQDQYSGHVTLLFSSLGNEQVPPSEVKMQPPSSRASMSMKRTESALSMLQTEQECIPLSSLCGACRLGRDPFEYGGEDRDDEDHCDFGGRDFQWHGRFVAEKGGTRIAIVNGLIGVSFWLSLLLYMVQLGIQYKAELPRMESLTWSSGTMTPSNPLGGSYFAYTPTSWDFTMSGLLDDRGTREAEIKVSGAHIKTFSKSGMVSIGLGDREWPVDIGIHMEGLHGRTSDISIGVRQLVYLVSTVMVTSRVDNSSICYFWDDMTHSSISLPKHTTEVDLEFVIQKYYPTVPFSPEELREHMEAVQSGMAPLHEGIRTLTVLEPLRIGGVEGQNGSHFIRTTLCDHQCSHTNMCAYSYAASDGCVSAYIVRQPGTCNAVHAAGKRASSAPKSKSVLANIHNVSVSVCDTWSSSKRCIRAHSKQLDEQAVGVVRLANVRLHWRNGCTKFMFIMDDYDGGRYRWLQESEITVWQQMPEPRNALVLLPLGVEAQQFWSPSINYGVQTTNLRLAIKKYPRQKTWEGVYFDIYVILMNPDRHFQFLPDDPGSQVRAETLNLTNYDLSACTDKSFMVLDVCGGIVKELIVVSRVYMWDPAWTQSVKLTFQTRPHLLGMMPLLSSKLVLRVDTINNERPLEWKMEETCSLDFRGLTLSVFHTMLAREVFDRALTGQCRTVVFQATEDIKVEVPTSTWMFLGLMLNLHRSLNSIFVTNKIMYDTSVGGSWTFGFTDEGMSFEYHGPDVHPFFVAVAPELVHYGEKALSFRNWTALWEDVTTHMQRNFSRFVAKHCKDSGKRPISVKVFMFLLQNDGSSGALGDFLECVDLGQTIEEQRRKLSLLAMTSVQKLRPWTMFQALDRRLALPATTVDDGCLPSLHSYLKMSVFYGCVGCISKVWELTNKYGTLVTEFDMRWTFLALRNNFWPDPPELFRIIRDLLQLLSANATKLLLDRNDLGLYGLKTFGPAIANMTKLKVLSASVTTFSHFGNCSYSQDQVAEVFSFLGSQALQQTLEKLKLPAYGLCEAGLQGLLPFLKHLSRLRSLSLKSNALGEVGARLLSTAWSELKQLESLDMRDNDLDTSGIEALNLPGLTSLMKLNIGRNRLNPSDDYGKIGSILSRLPRLRVLELEDVKMQDGLAKLIAKGLPCLEELRLRNTSLTERSFDALRDWLAKCSEKGEEVPKLKVLDVSWASGGVQIMDSCMLFMRLPPTLQELSVRHLGMQDDFVKMCLIPGLRQATSLRSLRLDGNNIGQRGFALLLEQLVKNNAALCLTATLTKFTMSSNVNEVNGVRLPLPTDGLSKLRMLTALDMSDNLVNVTTFELPSSVRLLRLNNVSAVAGTVASGSQWLALVDKLADMQRSGHISVASLGLAKNVFPAAALDRLMYRLSDFNRSITALYMGEVSTDVATLGERADVGWSLTNTTLSPTCLACLRWVTWDAEPWKLERLQLLYPRTTFYAGRFLSESGLDNPFKYDTESLEEKE